MTMSKNLYQSLNKIYSKIEKVLQLKKNEGLINNFSIEKILDDYSIEIYVFYPGKLKKVKTTIFLGKKKKNADNI